LVKVLKDLYSSFGVFVFWWQNTKYKAIFFLLSLCISMFICLKSFSQNEIEPIVQTKMEELSESSTNDLDFSDLADKLDDLTNHPVNINQATADELRQIPFLTQNQINNLITYKETYGELLSIYEFQSIEGFDSATIQHILPLITVSNIEKHHRVRFKELFTNGRCNLLLRYQQILQEQQGYSVPDSVLRKSPDAGYPGAPQKYWFRLNYDYFDRISIGVTGDKDPGEEFFKGSQPYGMDFYSGYFAIKNTGFLKSLILGNFNVDFGQGLTLGSALSFGALPSSGNLRRYAGEVRPSLGINENSYLRGIAANVKIKKISISAFYSRHKRDANIISIDSLTGDAKEVSSFQETGYHRLPDELSEKNAIREVIYGGNINFRNSFFTVGMTCFHSDWNAACTPTEKPYSRYQFSGRSNLNMGADFQFIFRTIYGFGEISRSINGGIAWLAGIQVNPDPNVKFSMIYRDYQPSYQNLISNAIGQISKNANEKGLILNISSRFNSKMGIYAYIDIYKFPWLKYRTDFLSNGSEVAVQVDYNPAKTVIMLLRYRIKSGQINESSDMTMKPWINIRRQSLRYQTNWQINPTIMLSNRLEIVNSLGETMDPEYGYVISQDVSIRPQRVPCVLSLRYALFNTDSYETRIYTYENDVMYGFSVPALEGIGIRLFLLLSWKPYRFLELWLRYAQTFYSDRNVIGTGLETINGNMKSEIKIQSMIRL
jgi:DNA uptake protein ComE-like DNA-binding protein